MAGRALTLHFFRIVYWLLVPLAFCSSFFIYLPGPTLSLASLHPLVPVAAPVVAEKESRPTQHSDNHWHHMEHKKELVFIRPLYEVSEWPHTVGQWGWILGFLLTPIVLIGLVVLLGRCLWAGLRRRPMPQASINRALRWGGLPLALVLGVGFGIKVVIPWSYRYSVRRAQPLIGALQQYKHDHPTDTSPMPPLVPRYLPALPTPGTLGSGYFEYGELWPPNLAFSYPHAPAIFPAYRVEYVPGPFQYTNDTQPAGIPDWQLRIGL